MKHVRAVRLVVGLTFRADPWRASTSVLLQVVEALSYACTAYGLKLLVDAATRGDGRGAAWAAVAVAGLAAAENAANWAGFTLRARLREETEHALDRRLLELTLALPGLDHLERPDRADQFALLVAQRGVLSGLPDALVQGLGLVVQAGAVLALLVSVHPALLLLPLFGLPSLLGATRGERIAQRAHEQTAEAWRRRHHVFSLCTSPSFGKEVRVFGLKDELVGRHAAADRQVEEAMHGADVRAALVGLAGWAVFGAAFVGAVALVAHRAVRSPGQTSAGDVVLALTLARQVSTDLAGAVAVVARLARSLHAAGRLLWLSDLAGEAARSAPQLPEPVPDRLTSGIRLRQLSFRYPGAEEATLADVDLLLPAGSTVAVVGDNGAGKSTLVKLLCRFYDPDLGAVLIDGIDLRRCDVEAWRSRVSGAFQDPARFEETVRATVGLGHLPAMDDEAAVTMAVGRAGATDLVGSLPDGLATPLGGTLEGGLELSAGQWQQLALSRAMMRDPLLLVLDEPTASLDARAEHHLFERLTAAARTARAGGAVTVLVSHRFSTVRMADLIVVLDHGRVLEVGSHDDLMARGGLYAELYELQARGYR